MLIIFGIFSTINTKFAGPESKPLFGMEIFVITKQTKKDPKRILKKLDVVHIS